ncbi:hypothetical protein PALB_19930 [Pseudoalteromonas luteoviolacea B = ATCC 29581]|nr:hypothetical protein PALB_19930 [Pseudoalteromonas luteoviolacea B = ATCC 29581]
MKKLIAATSLMGFSSLALAAETVPDWGICIGIWKIGLCVFF